MSGLEFHHEACWLSNAGGEGVGMVEYRAFTVGPDGHFVGSEALICADDSEAIEKAKGFVDGQDIELWSGARFITRLKHKPESDI